MRVRYLVAFALALPVSVLAVFDAALLVPGVGSGVVGAGLFFAFWVGIGLMAGRAQVMPRVFGRASLALSVAAAALPFAVWRLAFGSGGFAEQSEGVEGVGVGIGGGIFLSLAIIAGGAIALAALLVGIVLLVLAPQARAPGSSEQRS